MLKKIISNVFFVLLCLPSLARGFYYEKFLYDSFTTVHVLLVNPNEHLILPVKAIGAEISRETVAILATAHSAGAGINGGFWKLDGTPAGALKIENDWYGTPNKPRGALGWSPITQTVLIDQILTNYSLKDCPESIQIQVIPASIPPYTSPEEWKDLPYIVGGTPVLIRNGEVIEDFSSEQTLESFLLRKHPRTAVGIKDDGDWVFAVVDSGFTGLFGGMTIKELAYLMLDLGCTEALNLDGGGSSTMVIEGSVVNEPHGKILEDGKYVEAVSDAILIF